MPKVLLIHGPNLNTLGTREPHIYGTLTLDDINARLKQRAEHLSLELEAFQSNHEGALIDFIQTHAPKSDGIIINAGALTHTSIAIHDALAALKIPIFEVHISNIYARESFRHHSYLAPIAQGHIVGFGWRGYLWALEELAIRFNL